MVDHTISDPWRIGRICGLLAASAPAQVVPACRRVRETIQAYHLRCAQAGGIGGGQRGACLQWWQRPEKAHHLVWAQYCWQLARRRNPLGSLHPSSVTKPQGWLFPGQCRHLRALRRNSLPTVARRRRHSRQSRLLKERGRRSTGSPMGRLAPVPAAIIARSQPIELAYSKLKARCERRRPELSTLSAKLSATISAICSSQVDAETSSRLPDMRPINYDRLNPSCVLIGRSQYRTRPNETCMRISVGKSTKSKRNSLGSRHALRRHFRQCQTYNVAALELCRYFSNRFLVGTAHVFGIRRTSRAKEKTLSQTNLQVYSERVLSFLTADAIGDAQSNTGERVVRDR